MERSLLRHYADRIPALEHRYLIAILSLRASMCELVFVTSQAPPEDVLDYYFALLPEEVRQSARSRFHMFVVDDVSARPLTEKLLERDDVRASLRGMLDGRIALIDPWNVREGERDLAIDLGVPINGPDPEHWALCTKSGGRRIFAEVGVPLPAGAEDIHSVDQAAAAIDELRTLRPSIDSVVIKHDDSGAGDGNAIIELVDLPPAGSQKAFRSVRERIAALPAWYVEELSKGGIVEQHITDPAFSSPSVQLEITPLGDVILLATHEQVLGGDNGHVYQGCRFPAEPAYSAEIARHAGRIGEALAERGVIGRFGVDFAAVGHPDGRWDTYALEINLRKGGTTHPFEALANLIPGRYDAESATFRRPGGPAKYYVSTDNLVDPAWTGLTPGDVVSAVAAAGLAFDRGTGTGVVLHMLSCLAVDGRFGLTAIGETPEQAADLYERARNVVAARASL